jgi:hypothetical protein
MYLNVKPVQNAIKYIYKIEDYEPTTWKAAILQGKLCYGIE